MIPEDWIVEQLENFTSFISYGFTNPMPTANDGPPMITARDINSGKIQLESARRTTDIAYKALLSAKSKPKINDVLLTKDGTLGRLALVEQNGVCINQSVALLRPNGRIVPNFFKLLLESDFYQSKMLDDAGGSTIKHIYITIVNKMLIQVPASKQEQTAIANALSDVDALIAALEKLIDKKSAIKTATMQQLLTGKKRLPPFDQLNVGYQQTELGEIPRDWEVKRFEEIANLKNIRTNPKVTGGGDFCIELEHIQSAVGSLDGSTVTTISSSLKNNFAVGDVLFGKLRSYLRKYWMADREGVCSTEIWVLEASQRKTTPQFLYQIVKSEKFIECTTEAYGTHMPRSDWKIVKDFLVPTPDIQEQTSIANVLSDIDTELDALQQRLAKTQHIKQGMMQELLTGKTRLVTV